MCFSAWREFSERSQQIAGEHRVRINCNEAIVGDSINENGKDIDVTLFRLDYVFTRRL